MIRTNPVECTAPIFAVAKIAPSRPILPNPYTERVPIAYRPRVAALREAPDGRFLPRKPLDHEHAGLRVVPPAR